MLFGLLELFLENATSHQLTQDQSKNTYRFERLEQDKSVGVYLEEVLEGVMQCG